MGRQPQGTTYWSPNNRQHIHDTQKQLPISNTPPPELLCTIAYYELDQQVTSPAQLGEFVVEPYADTNFWLIFSPISY